MRYINNKFFIEGKNVESLTKKFNTPLYCYSYKNLRENVENFKKAFKEIKPLICFSVKSNSNISLLKEIKKLGLGADVVSKGELYASLKAGIDKNKIVFSGVGKTRDEIEYAIKQKILLINSESLSEVLAIEKAAKKLNKVVNIGLRLNPDTDAETLKQISTGKSENKFGVDKKTFVKIINLMKDSKFIMSTTGRIRNVIDSEGLHLFSPRLAEGGLSLTVDGAKKLHSLRNAPIPSNFSLGKKSNSNGEGPAWVVVDSDAEPFVKQGRNVMHGFVTACDNWTRPDEHVLIVNQSGDLLAFGRSQSTPEELSSFTKGIAVKVREGCP